MPVQPATQRNVGRQQSRLARQIGENGLHHILSEVRVSAHAPHRHGIHEIHVPTDELAEGRFRAVTDVVAQELVCFRHTVFTLYKAVDGGNPTIFSRIRAERVKSQVYVQGPVTSRTRWNPWRFVPALLVVAALDVSAV